MTEIIGEALVEGIRVYGNTRREEARYAYLSGGPKPARTTPTPKAEELTVPDVELNNYVRRSEVEDGQHVLVVEHTERLEKKFVPAPPPTAEEIADEREQKRYMARIAGGVAAVAMVVVGAVIIVERRTPKVIAPPVT